MHAACRSGCGRWGDPLRLGDIFPGTERGRMSIDWTPLSSLIETYDRFVVTSHVRPDGDALGSEVGMVGLLRQKGKDVRVVNISRTPPRYDFLDPDGTLFEHFGTAVGPEELADREVLVILDLSSWG